MQLKPRCSHWLLIGLAVALVASVVLNFLLYAQTRDYYAEVNQVHLDPLSKTYFDSEPIPSPVSPGVKRVVFFGDSRAEQWMPPSNLNQFQFVNRGIGNQTTAQVLERFDYHVAPLDPDIVIIQVGINDLKSIPLFPTHKQTIVANCKENIRQIVTQSVDIGATVILTTIFPVGPVPLERQLVWSPEIARSVEHVNVYIRSLASKNVIVLDAFATLTRDGTMRTEFAQDTLHLNAAGYAALNDALVLKLSATVQ